MLNCADSCGFEDYMYLENVVGTHKNCETNFFSGKLTI